MRIRDWSSDVCSSDLFEGIKRLWPDSPGLRRRRDRAGPRSWRDRKRPARCSGWRSIPTVCGYIMMTMAVDVASRAGAHQPGFRRHVNTFTVAIALEQFDKATEIGRAHV